MNKELIKTIALRFIRAFVAGSIASMLAIISTAQFNPEVIKDPYTFIYSLMLGALSGGLQAVDKLYRWQDAPTNN
jgi:hypothetical protein